RTAPMPDQVAGLIKFEDRRRLRAACAGLLIRGGFIRRERVGPMNDPDMVLRVNPHADSHSDVPMVRQRFRPQPIDLEPGRHDHGFPLNSRHLLQRSLTNEKRDKKREEGRADIDIVSFHILCKGMDWAFSTRRIKGSKEEKLKGLRPLQLLNPSWRFLIHLPT